MKIRIAVLAAMIIANAVACSQTPTSVDPGHRTPAHSVHDGDVTDTTTNRSGVLGSGH